MKILLVNTYDTGGAARACIRLHQGLLAFDVDSKLLLKNKSNINIPESFQYILLHQPNSYTKRQIEKVKRILKHLDLFKEPESNEEKYLSARPKELEWFSFPSSKCDITQSTLYREADIVNLHWVARFLDYGSFFKKNKKPVIWTLHDMNPFSGGEHYNERYIDINKLGLPVKRILSKEDLKIYQEVVEMKKEALKGVRNLQVVCPSKWLQKEAQISEVFNKYEIHHIPNGIDSEIFQPRDRFYSRELLGILKDSKVLLFISDSLIKFRKGYRFLLQALEKIVDKNVLLCSIGNYEYIEKSQPSRIVEFGNIQDERFLSVIYSAADVFIIPSLEDNLPNTVLESLLCGTPVIGFPAGGIPEIIQDGINGYICPEISVQALSDTIIKFLHSDNLFSAEIIRKEALSKYKLNIQVTKYLELYKNMMTNAKLA